jgi:tetratricopeptide (TPR) repeat protein
MADYPSYEAPAHEATALPVTVPPKLIGRDAVLGQVYARLRENKTVLLWGAPGIGKTALAATLAAAYTEQPGGVLWFQVEQDSLEQLLARVGRAYQVAEIANSERPLGMVGAVASTLTQHKPLIVLDGRLNPEVVTAFVTRCAERLPVLLVNQQEFGGDTLTALKLEALEAAHAVTLLKQAAGLGAGPDPDAERLAQTLRYVPMALVVAGATLRAAKQTPIQYLNALTQIPGYTSADPALLAVTAGFRSLTGALQGLLIMMGAMFQGQATAEVLSKVSGAPQPTIEQAMRLLAQQQLVEATQRHGLAFYSLHPLVHKFAETLAGEQRLADLRVKIRDALVDCTRRYSDTADEAAYNQLSALMTSLMALGEWAAQRGDLETVNALAAALMRADDFVSERGYVYELLRLRRLSATSTTAFPASDFPTRRPEALILPADEDEDEAADEDAAVDEEEDFDEEIVEELDEDDEDEAQPAFFRDLFADEDEDDLAYEEDDEEIEDTDEDEELNVFIPEIPAPAPEAPIAEDDIPALRAALMTARQRADIARQLSLLKMIGKAQILQHHDNEAITTYNEIIALYEDRDEDADLLDALDTLASLMIKTDNPQPAVLYASRGIQLAGELGEAETQMHLYVTLGDARQQLGESDAAEKAYAQALEIARTRDDAQNEALILYKLGYAQLDNSDPEGASMTWEQALKLFREQKKSLYEGKVLGGLGTAYGELGRWSEAARFHTSALYIAREAGDQTEEALQLSNLAYAAAQAHDLAQAVLRYRQALHLAYERDDRENIVSTILDLAGLLVTSPRHLAIAKLLVEDAARFEPGDRDVNNLQQRIASELAAQQAAGIEQRDVRGTARDYAANAYKLLDA